MNREELIIWIKENLFQINNRLKTAYLCKLNKGIFPEIYSLIYKETNFLDKEKSLSERIYCLMNNIDCIEKIPRCLVCNKITKVDRYKEGYRKYCNNNKCGKLDRVQKFIEENTGKKRPIEWRNNISKGLMGHEVSDKAKNNQLLARQKRKEAGKMIPWNKNKPWSTEVKNKISLKLAIRLEKEGRAGFNIKSLEWFKWINDLFDLKGRFALKENGEEKRILQYFVDFYDKEKKIIIEWDEEEHYKYGVLNEADIQRQKNIIKELPDFKFIRIREKDFLKLSLEEKYNYIFIRLNNN